MSEKSLAERLQVKGTRKLAMVGAPSSIENLIGPLVPREAAKSADIVLLFVSDQAALKANRISAFGTMLDVT